MFQWFQKLRRKACSHEQEDAEPESSPAWVDELAELLQKTSRAQARLGMKLDDLDRKLEGGFGELRASLAVTSRAPESSPARWDDLLDAMDLLEEAARSLDGEGVHAETAEGLRRVLARLECFLDQNALQRLAPVGTAPDGKTFRVVGTAQRADLPDGVIARVVRAAVLSGGRVVREGEVLTNRRLA